MREIENMGSFNVACSVSSLSINSGEDVFFLPLLPNNSRDGKHEVHPTSSLIYADCYFTPFCLPIQGVYNDYGSIEQIVKDDNTQAIENYFGISIEEFIEEVTVDGQSLDLDDARKQKMMAEMSGMFIHGHVYKELVHFHLTNEGHSLQEYVTGRALSMFGFEKKQDLKEPHYDSLWRKDGFPFEVMVGNYGSQIVEFGHDQPHSVYSIASFVEVWGKETGEVLSVSSLENVSKYDLYYDDFQIKLNDYQKEIQELTEAIEKASENEKPMLTKMLNMEFRNCPITGYAGRDDNFMGLFSKWKVFRELYKETLFAGKLKKHCTDFRSFYWSMYSCNRFFFPAMNGEQCGNAVASKVLYEASLAVVNAQIKDRIDEDQDEDD
jgi:hypothetical protein